MILCFHNIGYEKNKYTITPEEFKKVLLKYPEAEIHFDDGRNGALLFGLPILKEMKRKATLFLVPYFLIGKIPELEKYSLFMSSENVKQWIKEGFEIGSHSYSHSDLTKSTESDLEYELQKSKNYLEIAFNTKITKFAYPYGIVNAEIKKKAEKIYKKCYSLDSDLGIKRSLVIL